MSSNGLYRVLPAKPEELPKVSYIKKLKKRHKSAWVITQKALIAEIERIDALLQKRKANVIKAINGHRLVKIEFTIAGSKKSTKASGHRSIVYVDNELGKAQILMAYHKNDLGGSKETASMKAHIKSAYPEIAKRFSL